MSSQRNKSPIHRCDSYMTNFKRCWLAATHTERCPNGVDYFCDHHAQMRKKQGGTVAAIQKAEANQP